jgi:hypothetical protein
MLAALRRNQERRISEVHKTGGFQDVKVISQSNYLWTPCSTVLRALKDAIVSIKVSAVKSKS